MSFCSVFSPDVSKELCGRSLAASGLVVGSPCSSFHAYGPHCWETVWRDAKDWLSQRPSLLLFLSHPVSATCSTSGKATRATEEKAKSLSVYDLSGDLLKSSTANVTRGDPSAWTFLMASTTQHQIEALCSNVAEFNGSCGSVEVRPAPPQLPRPSQLPGQSRSCPFSVQLRLLPSTPQPPADASHARCVVQAGLNLGTLSVEMSQEDLMSLLHTDDMLVPNQYGRDDAPSPMWKRTEQNLIPTLRLLHCLAADQCLGPWRLDPL